MARVSKPAPGELPISDDPSASNPVSDPLLVDETEAARLLSISVGKLRDLWQSGGGPSRVDQRAVGRLALYKRRTIERYVDELPECRNSADQFEANRIGGMA
jgi:hypothetical protein